MPVRTYKKVLRKRFISSSSNSIFNILNNPLETGLEKNNAIYVKTVEGYFKKAIGFYKEKRLREALEEYDTIISISNEIYPFLDREVFDIVNVSQAEIQTTKNDRIFRLYTLAQRAGDSNLNNLTEINLLENSVFSDSNNDAIPDKYLFLTFGKEATNPNKEIILGKEFNVYHVWCKDGKGWFSLNFNLGRIPRDVYFTFSIDVKKVNIKGKLLTGFRAAKASGQWIDCHYIDENEGEELMGGWERKYCTIRVNNYSEEVFLSGWIVAWDYGPASGDVFVRKPKLEIGKKSTPWRAD